MSLDGFRKSSLTKYMAASKWLHKINNHFSWHYRYKKYASETLSLNRLRTYQKQVHGRYWRPLPSVHGRHLMICAALTPYPQYTAVNNGIVSPHWQAPCLWLILVLCHDIGVIIPILSVLRFVFTAHSAGYNFKFSTINSFCAVTFITTLYFSSSKSLSSCRRN